MTAKKGIDRLEIWQDYQAGIPQTVIARKFGIARNTVAYHIAALKKELGSTPDNVTPLHSPTTEAAGA
jgi:DNA-binding NarL/FixJ family response regulator